MSRDVKYIGMDVHKEATVMAVRNTRGDLVMESIVETESSTILQFIHGVRGELHVTWEEGTWAAWLYDLLKPHAHEVLVCQRTSASDATVVLSLIARSRQPPRCDNLLARIEGPCCSTLSTSMPTDCSNSGVGFAPNLSR